MKIITHEGFVKLAYTGDQKNLRSINRALDKYNELFNKGKKELRKALNAIIETTATYLTQVEPDKRKDLPYAELILKIHKQAVANNYLTKVRSNSARKTYQAYQAEARWKLLKEFFGLYPDETLKRMQDKYWIEYQYQGREALANWLTDNNEKSQYYYKVASEIEKHESQLTGLGKCNVDYFNQNKHYKVKIKNGLLKNNSGNVIDTTHSYSPNRPYGQVIYAMSRTGELYISPFNASIPTNFHHSSFLKGAPVICAGGLEIHNGKLKLITVESGHYAPERKHLLRMLHELEKRGVSLEEVDVLPPGKQHKVNANRYIQMKGFAIPNTLKEIITIKQNITDIQSYIETSPKKEDYKPLIELIEKLKGDDSLLENQKLNIIVGFLFINFKNNHEESFNKTLLCHTDIESASEAFQQYKEQQQVSSNSINAAESYKIALMHGKTGREDLFMKYLFYSAANGCFAADKQLTLFAFQRKFGLNPDMLDDIRPKNRS